MSNWVYSDKVKEHFMNPRNIYREEEEFDYDGKGMAGNIKCGDQMMMMIKVDDKDTITDCRWKTFGCASAIASTSVLSEMVKGMSLEEASRISPKEIMEELKGLPENKVHCSVLGDKALRAAIDDFYVRTGRPGKVKTGAEKVVCQCMNVTSADIEHAVLEGARNYYELQEHTKLGTVCGRCKEEAEVLLREYKEKHFESENK